MWNQFRHHLLEHYCIGFVPGQCCKDIQSKSNLVYVGADALASLGLLCNFCLLDLAAGHGTSRSASSTNSVFLPSSLAFRSSLGFCTSLRTRLRSRLGSCFSLNRQISVIISIQIFQELVLLQVLLLNLLSYICAFFHPQDTLLRKEDFDVLVLLFAYVHAVQRLAAKINQGLNLAAKFFIWLRAQVKRACEGNGSRTETSLILCWQLQCCTD
mmetsp:Transcript_157040/g.273480  ORF Transcript_157040/g.273480 Transcript_157040/m.273480 type:complete len:213 (-) Transcript_157040:25-663(-)